MSKRKTRQEKIIADLHRKLQSQSSLSSSAGETSSIEKPHTHAPKYSYIPQVKVPLQISTIATTIDNRYIRDDLIKTTLVTIVIVSCQLLLFFLLKNNMITLPMVSY